MFVEAASLFMSVVQRCWFWFDGLLAATGGYGAYIAAFFIFQVGRFLLGPIFGTAVGVFAGSMGSDSARHGYGRDNSPNQKKIIGGKS